MPFILPTDGAHGCYQTCCLPNINNSATITSGTSVTDTTNIAHCCYYLSAHHLHFAAHACRRTLTPPNLRRSRPRWLTRWRRSSRRLWVSPRRRQPQGRSSNALVVLPPPAVAVVAAARGPAPPAARRRSSGGRHLLPGGDAADVKVMRVIWQRATAFMRFVCAATTIPGL